MGEPSATPSALESLFAVAVLFALLLVLFWHGPVKRGLRIRPLPEAMLQPVRRPWLLRLFQLAAMSGAYFGVDECQRAVAAPGQEPNYVLSGFAGAAVAYALTELWARLRGRLRRGPRDAEKHSAGFVGERPPQGGRADEARERRVDRKARRREIAR